MSRMIAHTPKSSALALHSRCRSGRRMSFLLFALLTLWLFPGSSAHTVHGIVIDAGSTGTRIHIYTFHQSAVGAPLELDGEIFESVKPGLSAFAEEPKKGAESVLSLLRLAQDHIPPKKWMKTPLVLKATAGLRLLPEHQAHALLMEVRKVFSASPFLIPENSVSIMNGTDEGVLAWITVNFLTGLLHGDHTVGILDLGGGSTQMTFLPLAKATLDRTPGDFLTTLEMFGSTYRLYTRSYLGLGLKAARLAVLEASVSAAPQNRTFRSHCFPAAMDADWTLDGVTYRYTGPSDGREGFDACYTEVRRILQGKIHHIAEIHDIRFYAFSYYYDRAKDTGLIEYEDGGELAVRDFALKAKEVCNHMDGVTRQRPFLCMDLTYITALLRHGFGFREDATLQLAKKVRDVETGWALGAIFRELQALVH